MFIDCPLLTVSWLYQVVTIANLIFVTATAATSHYIKGSWTQDVGSVSHC